MEVRDMLAPGDEEMQLLLLPNNTGHSGSSSPVVRGQAPPGSRPPVARPTRDVRRGGRQKHSREDEQALYK